jgi:hypothetical protein|tara:strand:+ start:354 stop:464 length:111 start_codon:yes stop_codon:yes gene_type:complete
MIMALSLATPFVKLLKVEEEVPLRDFIYLSKVFRDR